MPSAACVRCLHGFLRSRMQIQGWRGLPALAGIRTGPHGALRIFAEPIGAKTLVALGLWRSNTVVQLVHGAVAGTAAQTLLYGGRAAAFERSGSGRVTEFLLSPETRRRRLDVPLGTESGEVLPQVDIAYRTWDECRVEVTARSWSVMRLRLGGC